MNAQNRTNGHGDSGARDRSDRSRLAKSLALFLALVLSATACSSGDGAGGENAEEGSSATTTADREDAGAVDDEAAGDTVSDRGDAGSGTATPDSEASVGREEAMGEASDASGPDQGFFGREGDDSDLEEDNTFEDYGIRGFVDTDVDPLSTFALDVDTASYSIGRRWLQEGVLPPADSVRVEEYVNSFGYDYPAPSDGLTIVAEGGPSPFDTDKVIVQLGVQAEVVADRDRPDASLVFVVDTSGSMGRQSRLELVKSSLKRLVRELDRDDSVAIVTYRGCHRHL